MSKDLGITARGDNYADWYNELVVRADLAENSGVRGCMVIKPHGYRVWELMQQALDGLFKATGHVNAYFPLFIPKSYFEQEAEHVEGFAKECAVVTHYRLKANPNGKGLIPDPEAVLEEPLIIRPTSETVIWNTYKRWIQSYRDLPLLINQWANVVRWEMRTRLFLRTAEFLWQEGHTAHATYEEAEQESLTILHQCYARFAEEWMAVPVLRGIKSDVEKFAGADHTYCIEALTQDLRCIQAGTSHHLGQNFAKAFDVQFQSAEGKLEYVYATSWGVSTRLIGTLIMAHSDDKGFVPPPRLAPIQVALVPMGRTDEEWEASVRACRVLESVLTAKRSPITTCLPDGRKMSFSETMRVKIDLSRNASFGQRMNNLDMLGACIKIEVGPRDLAQGKVMMSLRVPKGDVEKVPLKFPEWLSYPSQISEELLKKDPDLVAVRSRVRKELRLMQNRIYQRALEFREANTHRVDTWEEFQKAFEGEGGGGFVLAHWDGTTETEEAIADKTKATLRCILLEPLHPDDEKPGVCVYSGKPSAKRVVFAKAY